MKKSHNFDWFLYDTCRLFTSFPVFNLKTDSMVSQLPTQIKVKSIHYSESLICLQVFLYIYNFIIMVTPIKPKRAEISWDFARTFERLWLCPEYCYYYFWKGKSFEDKLRNWMDHLIWQCKEWQKVSPKM